VSADRRRIIRLWPSLRCCSPWRLARRVPRQLRHGWRQIAQVLAVAVNVIIDIEYPRIGLIRVAAFDQALRI
jgi:hypothetical protein